MLFTLYSNIRPHSGSLKIGFSLSSTYQDVSHIDGGGRLQRSTFASFPLGSRIISGLFAFSFGASSLAFIPTFSVVLGRHVVVVGQREIDSRNLRKAGLMPEA